MLRDDLSALPNEMIQKELKKPLLGLSPRCPFKINSISGFITLPQVSKHFHGLFFLSMNANQHQIFYASY